MSAQNDLAGREAGIDGDARRVVPRADGHVGAILGQLQECAELTGLRAADERVVGLAAVPLRVVERTTIVP